MASTRSKELRSIASKKHAADTTNVTRCKVTPIQQSSDSIVTPSLPSPTLQSLQAYCSPAFGIDQLDFHKTTLGEGHNGKVVLADYRGVLVACKMRRQNQPRSGFMPRLQRELSFAAELAVCRSMNQYLGLVACKRSEFHHSRAIRDPNGLEFFVVQRYYQHGDLLAYVENRDKPLHPMEVVRIGIALFSALTDAHKLDIGIVDVKRENVLIDHTGSAILTDFGSCVRMQGRQKISLLEEGENDVLWTKDVAAPEMISSKEFWLTSDVFMGTLILAELMTGHLTNDEFSNKVLQRHSRKGSVCFQPNEIPVHFSPFNEVLVRGLDSDPSTRISAAGVLEMLNKIQDTAFNIYINDGMSSFRSKLSHEDTEQPYEDYDQVINAWTVPPRKSYRNNGYVPKRQARSPLMSTLALTSSDEDGDEDKTGLKPHIPKNHIQTDSSTRPLENAKSADKSAIAVAKRQRLLRESNKPFFFGQRVRRR